MCSAISLVPILSEASCATIQGIFACHVFLSSRIREASEENWLLLGIMARLAQSIGLHRDGSQFDLDAAEVQRRRITFWELYSWDAWTALTTGRPPAMSLADISSKIPCDGLDIFHTWRFNFAAECLWPALRITLGTTASYDATMQMDQKVRAFPVPPQLQPHVDGAEVHPWPIDIACAMRRCLVINFKELTLLSLHRNYFALALTGEHANPLEHKFRGSVLAAYHTATCLSGSLRDLYSTHPTFVRKLWYFWSAMFSACIILAAVPIFRPNCTLARGALLELRAACGLFVEGTQNHCFSGATYILERLRQRAEWSLDTYWNDPLTHRGAYLRPGEVDELRILGGLETTIHYSYPRYSQSPPPYLPQVSDIRAQASIGSVRPSGVRLQQPRRPHNEPISSYQHILSGSYRSSPRNEFVRAANGGVALPCTISNNMNKGITVTGLLSSRSGPSVGLQLDPQPMDRSSVSRSESYTESVDNMVWRSFMESLVDQGSLQSLHPFPI